jgi:hypothetical protein
MASNGWYFLPPARPLMRQTIMEFSMLRIRTRLGDSHVLTLPTISFPYGWTTVSIHNRQGSSVDAADLHQASINHLEACRRIVEMQGGVNE